MKFLLLTAFGLLALAPAACGRRVGDACKYNTECNEATTERTCDLSQPGGYCTIEGCDEKSCPSKSVCIRFFPRLFLTKPCNPASLPACQPDELCLPSGLCAPRASERRYCALGCSTNNDCRGGYECRLAGTLGTVALVVGDPDQAVRFCAPVAPPPSTSGP